MKPSAHSYFSSLTLLLLLSLNCNVWAAKKTSAKPDSKPPSGKASVLFDHWYTISLGKSAHPLHYGYYNDRVEIRGGKAFYQNHVWKQEEDYLNEEQLGAYAENTADLEPQFYNFHSTYRTTETSVDGTVASNRLLTVKSRRAGSDLPIVKKSLPPGAIFSIFFPLWLKRHQEGLKIGKPLGFHAVVEDNIEQEFTTLHGTVKEEKPDSQALSTHTRKILVDYRGLRSYWWIDESGTYLRMEMPQQKMLVQKVSESEARAFLTPPLPSSGAQAPLPPESEE